MDIKSFKGFYRFTDLEHHGNVHLKEQFNILQKVPNDGVEYEFMISFYEIGHKLFSRVEIFDDAFVAFETHSELFNELSNLHNVMPNEIEQILVSLGYTNLTKEETENNGR